jgi:MFS family permease
MTFFMSLTFFGAVLMPFFTEWGKITQFQVFLLQSWFALCLLLLEIPTGVVADHVGRKHSLVMGGICVVIGALIYGSVPGFQMFLLSEFLLALGMALHSGADEALLYDILKEEGKEADAPNIIGKAESMRFLGLLISAPLGSLAASQFGLNVPMLMTAIPFSIGTVIALSIREPGLHRVSESRRYIDVAVKGIRFFYTHNILRLVAADAIIVSVASYYVIWLYQPVLQNLRVPVFWFGYFYMLMAITELIISQNYVTLEKIAGSRMKYLRVTALVSALAFFAVALYPNALTVIALLVFAGGFGYTRMKFMSAYMNSMIPSTERATVLSFIQLLRRVGTLVLNPFIGFMADRSLGTSLFLIGLLPLLVFLFSPLKSFPEEKN